MIFTLSNETLGILIALGAVAFMLFIVFIKANLVICQPNEVVIISGRRRKLQDGTVVGYRLLKGGRGFKVPIIESVRRLPLNALPIEIRLTKALTQGIIPINVDGLANAKIAGSEKDGLLNAIERFLGRNLTEVGQLAKETIEGSLRSALAQVTPEEANAERQALAEQAAQLARTDLHKLGIVVDFVKIKNISDDQGYLEAIGRQKTAEVLKNARIAEATAEAEARTVSAEQKSLGAVAEARAEESIVEAENKLKVHRASLAAEANRAEQRVKVTGDIARVEEELKLEQARIELNRRKQMADTVVPAEAGRTAAELRAQGDAARILEDGKATAEAVKLMLQQWDKGNTRELFLIQMLPELLDKVTKVVADNLHIERVTVLDSGNGEGLPTHVRNVAGSAIALLEQLKNATGIDVAGLLQGAAHGGKRGDREIPKELG